MRILIIDDNPTSLQSLSVVLTDLGHQPVTFCDPVAALNHAQESYYPLIITDVKMPVLDGLSLLKELKNNDRSSRSDTRYPTSSGTDPSASARTRRCSAGGAGTVSALARRIS